MQSTKSFKETFLPSYEPSTPNIVSTMLFFSSSFSFNSPLQYCESDVLATAGSNPSSFGTWQTSNTYYANLNISSMFSTFSVSIYGTLVEGSLVPGRFSSKYALISSCSYTADSYIVDKFRLGRRGSMSP